MFKRRAPRSYVQIVSQAVWPRGGWLRAGAYVVHRVRRLPDPAHRISRGIAAGVFVSFTPFYGFHFLLAALVAWLIRGNILAAMLATFVGNPLTFPFIAAVSMEVGNWILGQPSIPIPKVFGAFSRASVELWSNFAAIFTPQVPHWDNLWVFFHGIFLPYLIGGLLPGLAAGLATHWLSKPVIASYQRGRLHALKERLEARQRAADEAREARVAALKREVAERADGRAEAD